MFLAAHTPDRLPALLVLVASCALASLAFAQQDDDPFRRLDKNGDGQLTRDELPEGMRANFDRVDTNHDGVISREEDAAFRRGQAGPRPGQVPLPPSIRPTLDIPYAGTDNVRQRLDLLLPRTPASDQPLPVIAFIHGGAWQAGDKRGELPGLVGYVSSGRYAGVSIGYRLTDEALARPDPRLQGGHPLDSGQRLEVPSGPRPHRRAGGIGGRTSGGHARHVRRDRVARRKPRRVPGHQQPGAVRRGPVRAERAFDHGPIPGARPRRRPFAGVEARRRPGARGARRRLATPRRSRTSRRTTRRSWWCMGRTTRSSRSTSPADSWKD